MFLDKLSRRLPAGDSPAGASRTKRPVPAVLGPPSAGVPLRYLQHAASHPHPRTTMRRYWLANPSAATATYVVAAFLASAHPRRCPTDPLVDRGAKRSHASGAP